MSFIQATILTNPQIATDDAGVKTITATVDNQSTTSSLLTYATTPFKVNSNDTFVSEATAAKGSIVTGLVCAHVMDFMHARQGAAPISPLTRMIVS